MLDLHWSLLLAPLVVLPYTEPVLDVPVRSNTPHNTAGCSSPHTVVVTVDQQQPLGQSRLLWLLHIVVAATAAMPPYCTGFVARNTTSPHQAVAIRMAVAAVAAAVDSSWHSSCCNLAAQVVPQQRMSLRTALTASTAEQRSRSPPDLGLNP